jgi:hypothetical protein
MLTKPMLVWCYLAVLFASIADAADFRLTANRMEGSSKPRFELNGRPFYPIVYTDRFSKFTPSLLHSLHAQGFNAVQLAMDTEDASSPELHAVLNRCAKAGIPVLMEIHAWSLRDLLASRPELNLVMSDGEPVKYFHDFANPEIKDEYLNRYGRATKSLRPFFHKSIVAISVGAYDAYHLPDGEVHVDFVVPAHNEKRQTRLPYGKYAETAWREHLRKELPFAESDIDSLQSGACDPPTSRRTAKSSQEWHEWLLFRRDLVTQWLSATTTAVRESSQLPVGVSLDLNFAKAERFATPPFAWTKDLDFVEVYAYGRKADASYLGGLFRTVWREYSDAGVPMIGLCEFSSGLAGEARGDDYARECAPFTSGLMAAGPTPDKKHDAARVNAFIRWANAAGEAGLLNAKPAPAKILLVVNCDRTEPTHKEWKACQQANQPCDLLYVDTDWNGAGCDGYECVVVDFDLPLPNTSTSAVNPKFVRPQDLGAYLSRMQSTN